MGATSWLANSFISSQFHLNPPITKYIVTLDFEIHSSPFFIHNEQISSLMNVLFYFKKVPWTLGNFESCKELFTLPSPLHMLPLI